MRGPLRPDLLRRWAIPLRALRPWLWVAGVATAITAILHGPVLGDLTGRAMTGAFDPSHAWAFDHLARMLYGAASLDHQTERIGFPESAQLRFIAWVPALAVAPLQPLLGALGAYNLAFLLTPAASALFATALLRKLTGASTGVAAGAALAYALCPYALGSLANGQIEKAQLWILPATLLALDAALVRADGPRLATLAGVMVAATFTDPTLALLVPPAVVPWVLMRLWGQPQPRATRLRTAALLLGLLAAAMLPAAMYYGPSRDGLQAFLPASPDPTELAPRYVSPMAQPLELLLGHAARDDSPAAVNHVAYLGWPLLCALAAASLAPFRGRGPAWAAVLLGALLAMGSTLVLHNGPVTVGGVAVPMPARLLDLLGYPMARSGMYYRAAHIASLGLAVALAGVAARSAGRRALMIAWLGGLLAVADGVRVTRELWPRPAAPIPAHGALLALRDDPMPGAVLDLPLAVRDEGAGEHLLAALVHGRPTSALPRVSRLAELPHLQAWQASLEEALALADPAAARSALAGEGLRAVVCRTWLLEAEDPTLQALTSGLGEPRMEEEVALWLLEP